MHPLFTIATITYNSSKWVRDAIESVLASSFQDFEYLISDDCSTDDTWAIIQEYKDPRIKAWRNEKNIGEYPNRNKVLHQANGQYIFYIDGDDILYKHSLRELSEYIKEFPEAAAIWASGGIESVVFPYLFSPQEMTRLILFTNCPISVVGLTESLFKTEVLKQVGGFKESFIAGDTYIKRRLACEFSILLTKPGYAYWRVSTGQASNKLKYGYHNLIEMDKINQEIVHASYFPLKDKEYELASDNINTSAIKLLVRKTILKGKFLDFFRLMKIMNKSFTGLPLLFNKPKLNYKPSKKGEILMNKFHF